MDVSDYSEAITAGGEVKSEEVSQGTPKNLSNDSSMASSEQQQSIFALTLNEIQTRSGMSFRTMNMDDLLNTVSIDDFQISSHVVDAEPELNNDHENGVPQRPFSLPSPLSGKTIDEVWGNIQENGQPQQSNGGFEFARILERNEYVQLQRLGEMTLEDFLIAAGVIRPPSPQRPMQQEQDINLNDIPSDSSFFSIGGSCLNNNTGVSVGPTMGMEYGLSTRASCINGNGGMNSLMSDGSSPFNNMFNLGIGEPSGMVENGGPSNMGFNGYRKKRKYIPRVLDPDEERKQRRMIKNRQSAARSRARKQAYMLQLEKDLSNHEAENKTLKAALAEAEKKLKHEEHVRALTHAHTEPAHQGGEKESEMKGSFGPIRRTKSASW